MSEKLKEYLDELGDHDSRWVKIKRYFSVKKSKVWHLWYDLKEGIKSCWRWKGVIWKDRTWGDNQIVDILIHKLKMDSEAMRKRDIVQSVDKTYLKMQQVVNLLERYNKDDYMSKYNELHDAKWGEDRTYFVKSEEHNDWCEWKSERDERLTPEQLEQEQAEYRVYSEKAAYEQRKDLNDALLIMKKNLPYWWD